MQICSDSERWANILEKRRVRFSVADPDPGSGAFLTPGSGIRCLFDPWIRDPGMGKKNRIRIRENQP
jgi:hypothetical protein